MSKLLSVQVNFMCLLVFLMSCAAIVGHSEWFR